MGALVAADDVLVVFDFTQVQLTREHPRVLRQLRVACARGQPPLLYWARVPSGPSCYMTSKTPCQIDQRPRTALNEVLRDTSRRRRSAAGDSCARPGPVAPAGLGRLSGRPAWLAARRWRNALIQALHAALFKYRLHVRAAPGISNGATQQPTISGAAQAVGGVRQQPAIDGAPADGAVGPLVCQATARGDARTGRS